MLLIPSKMKYKKYQKQQGRLKGNCLNYNFPHTGFYGLKIKSHLSLRLKSTNLEAIKLNLQKKLKKKVKNKFFFTIFPDLPVTKKSAGVRMGKGKGSIDYWCVPVLSGRVLLELKRNYPLFVIKHNFGIIKKKLSIQTKLVVRKKFQILK